MKTALLQGGYRYQDSVIHYHTMAYATPGQVLYLEAIFLQLL